MRVELNDEAAFLSDKIDQISCITLTTSVDEYTDPNAWGGFVSAITKLTKKQNKTTAEELKHFMKPDMDRIG